MSAREDSMTDERLESLERWRDETDQKWIEAFPGGDAAGHRRFHEMMVEQAVDRKRLIAAVKEKTIGGLVWAMLFGLGVAVWQYIKSQIGK